VVLNPTTDRSAPLPRAYTQFDEKIVDPGADARISATASVDLASDGQPGTTT